MNGVPADLQRGLEAAHRDDLGATAMLLRCRHAAARGARPELMAATTGALLLVQHGLGEYRDLPAGTAALKQALPGLGFESATLELLAVTGLLCGLLFLEPDDAGLDALAARTLDLLALEADPNLALACGRMVIYYIEPREARATAQRLYGLMAPHLDDPRTTPYRAARWWHLWSVCAQYAQDARQAAEAVQEAERLARQHGLRGILLNLISRQVLRQLQSGDVDAAAATLAEAEAVARPGSLHDQWLLERARADLACTRQQGGAALHHTQRALALSRELGHPGPVLASSLVAEAHAQLLVDQPAQALALLDDAATRVPAGYASEVREMARLVQADAALREGRREALELLRNTWAAMRERQFYDTFENLPAYAARLCAQALAHEIEPEFVRTLIALRRLAPPPEADARWPWRLRIHALGSFRIERDGQPMAWEGKAQKKPLELLKALVALGGEAVPRDTLVLALWPGPDTDGGRNFDVTLLRLRKLLDVEGALVLSEGKLSLQRRWVWWDVQAFEQRFAALIPALREGKDEAAIQALAADLFGLYRDKLFGDEATPAWAAAARERLALKFGRAVADCGAWLEARGRWREAIDRYERGVALQVLAEPLYRGLMRCHAALGETAEALRVYRQCRELLLLVLGVPPGAETEALARRLRGD